MQMLRGFWVGRRLFFGEIEFEVATEQGLHFGEAISGGAVGFVHCDHEAAAGARPGEQILDVSIAETLAAATLDTRHTSLDTFCHVHR